MAFSRQPWQHSQIWRCENLAGEAYDYMIGMVITGILSISAIVVVPNLSYVNLLYVDQQQLRNIALNTLKTMLLDAGYPANWGSSYNFSQDQVERFGMALAGSSSFYVLDPDKVQRLIVDNPVGHIEYDDIRAKLELEGYGFNFRIITPFNVTANDGDPISVSELSQGIEVLVTYRDGSPIPGAFVEATLVYVLDNDVNNFYFAEASNSTNALGKCIIKQALPGNVSDFIIVFEVSVADVNTVTSSFMEGFHEHVVTASMIGDNVTLWIPEDDMPGNDTSSTRIIENIIAVDENNVWNMYTGGDSTDDKITYGQGYHYWSRMFDGLSADPPLFLIFNIRTTLGHGQGGRQLVLFVGPRPNWMGSRIEAYGDSSGVGGASSALRIQRDVVISGLTYIAELTLWKES